MSESHAPMISAASATLLEEGALDAARDYFAPGYEAHTTGRDLTGGPAAVRSFVEALRQAFAELAVEVEILVGSGDPSFPEAPTTQTFTASPGAATGVGAGAETALDMRDLLAWEGSRVERGAGPGNRRPTISPPGPPP